MIMKRSILRASSVVHGLWIQKRGATAIMFAVMLSGLAGVAGLTIDVGRVLAVRAGFSAETQAAALAGAQAMLASNATQTTVSAAVTAWNSANPPSNVTVTGTTTALSCITATSNLPSCTGTTPNAVKVTRTGTVTTYFVKAFGYPTFTISASASAAKAGGAGVPLNVMFILDSTGSMGSTDSNCTVPNVKSPTRFQCAEYSVQSILKVMQPTMSSVGLMVFPGMVSQYTPAKPCSTQPSSTPYLSSKIYYQVGTSLATDYNNGSGSLTSTSGIVEAVGDATNKVTGCLTNKGGQGTYLAEVIAKAQAALPVVTGTKNVIILLSDGDASASKAQLNNTTAKVSNQCAQYVTAAQTATTAGTTVYAVAYGAATSGCSTDTTYNPCSAMKAVASDTSKFFSTDTTCVPAVSGNTLTNLPSIFTQIAVNLTKPRLLTN
jgi:Flp pilus assembly protein TadG